MTRAEIRKAAEQYVAEHGSTLVNGDYVECLTQFAEHVARHTFVDGAAWWEYQETGFTIWGSDRRKAEQAAGRYGAWPEKETGR